MRIDESQTLNPIVDYGHVFDIILAMNERHLKRGAGDMPTAEHGRSFQTKTGQNGERTGGRHYDISTGIKKKVVPHADVSAFVATQEQNIQTYAPISDDGERQDTPVGKFLTITATVSTESVIGTSNSEAPEPFTLHLKQREEPVVINPISIPISYNVNDVIYSGAQEGGGEASVTSQYVDTIAILLPDGRALSLDGNDRYEYTQEQSKLRLTQAANSLSPFAVDAGLLPEYYSIENVPTNNTEGSINYLGQGLRWKTISLYGIGDTEQLHYAENHLDMYKRLSKETGLQDTLNGIVERASKTTDHADNKAIDDAFGDYIFGVAPFDMLATNIDAALQTDLGDQKRSISIYTSGKIRTAVGKALDVLDPQLAEQARAMETTTEVIQIIPEEIKRKIVDMQMRGQALANVKQVKDVIIDVAFTSPDYVYGDYDKKIALALDGFYRETGGLPDFHDEQTGKKVLRIVVGTFDWVHQDQLVSEDKRTAFGEKIKDKTIELVTN